MKSGFKAVAAVCALVVVSACVPLGPRMQDYWQRVNDTSALWMTGPKAQQQLDQNIATCVREIDELVKLDAIRETTPPDTHSEYHRALQASGDLDYYDTPTRMGEKMVSHTDFHDFESCMRSKGWERVKYVRYQVAQQSQNVYKGTQDIRLLGLSKEAADALRKKQAESIQANYQELNQ